MLIRKWKKTGVVEPSPVDLEIINEALLPQWLSLPPRKAAGLAVSSAESVDRELEQTSIETIEKIFRVEDGSRLYRSIHRKMHLDQIETLIHG